MSKRPQQSKDDKATPWAYDGKVKMSGCLCCVNAVEAGMGRPWEEGSQLYASKTDLEYNRQVDACAIAYEKLPASSLPRFSPEESVQTVTELGSESFVELAFLSEAQVLNLTGCNWKQLDLDLYQREGEDGKTILYGVYVHYSDLPPDFPLVEVLSWRKVRFYSRSSTAALSTHLTPSRQLRAGQALPLMKHLDSQTSKPHADKPGFFLANIPKLGALIDKGSRKLAAKEEALAKKMAQEEAARVEENERAQAASSDSGDVEEVQQKQGRARGGGGMQGGKVSHPDGKRKRAAKAKAVSGDAAAAASPGPSRKSAKVADESGERAPPETMSAADIKSKMSHDEELMKVCLTLGKVPECLTNLSLERCFTENVGNQLFSVPWLTNVRLPVPVRSC